MNSIKNASIEQLYRETFPFVARTVARLGGDLDAAKDIFHDALIIYLEKDRKQANRFTVSPTAYITGIARILWIRKFNLQSRLTSIAESEEELIIPEDFYPMEEIVPVELSAHLESAGKKCLELLSAFYYDQHSMQEIAERFHYKTRHSATVQKHKCLEKIREQLKTSAVHEKATA